MASIDYLMFADVVGVESGRPKLISGEYDRIRLPAFPYAYTLQIVFRVRCLGADAGEAFDFAIELTDGDGALLREPVVMNLAILRDAGTPAGADTSMQCCLTVPDIVFPKSGTYGVTGRISGQVAVSRDLHVLSRLGPHS